MTVRGKLLLLLLVLTLTPLTVISVLHQVTLRVARVRLTARIEKTLVSDACLQLQQLLESYREISAREIRLLDALVRHQAREAEFRLFGEPRPQASANHEEGRPQTIFLPEGVPPSAVARDLERLGDMTAVYREVHRLGPAGILWQYTSLENGLHLVYPRSARRLPQDYDPRTRPWYLQARTADDVVRAGPLADAITGKAAVTIAVALRRPDGSFAGVTAIDRMVPDILAGMKLPPRWAAGTERMLVTLDPRPDPCEAGVLVVLQSRAADSGDWQRPIQFQELRSRTEQFRWMTGDMRAGRPGVRRMDYQRRSSLWVYGRPGREGIIPLLIVPYQAVIEPAGATAHALLHEGVLWLRAAGILFAAMAVAAVWLAAVCATSVTRPINALARAAARLAEGDYSAQVRLTTGDELACLGAVFNAVGPKLRERQKMKKSLELAAALQRSLLPRQTPRLQHFELAGHCLYCDETGGDYYDFIDATDLGPGKVGVVVGDVSGHGLGAALLMTAARSSLRANTRRHGVDLARLLRQVNRDLVRDTGADKFLTLFYGILDDQDCCLTWAPGGHDPALWYHAASGAIEELPNTGMLLGIFEEATFEQAGPVALRSGDMVVVGTDGIWEARDEHGHLFGKERLHEILRQAHGSAEEVCRAILNAVKDFVGPAPRQDDVTVVVLKTRAAGASHPSPPA